MYENFSCAVMKSFEAKSRTCLCKSPKSDGMKKFTWEKAWYSQNLTNSRGVSPTSVIKKKKTYLDEAEKPGELLRTERSSGDGYRIRDVQ